MRIPKEEATGDKSRTYFDLDRTANIANSIEVRTSAYANAEEACMQTASHRVHMNIIIADNSAMDGIRFGG
jgi:hypothetical protein